MALNFFGSAHDYMIGITTLIPSKEYMAKPIEVKYPSLLNASKSCAGPLSYSTIPQCTDTTMTVSKIKKFPAIKVKENFARSLTHANGVKIRIKGAA